MTDKLVVPLLLLVVGALFGGLISAMTSRYATFKEARGIAAALRSEIESVLEMVELRGYTAGLAAVVSRLQDPAYQPTHQDLYGIKATRDFFAVFHSVSSKVGLLGDLSVPVIRLYVMGKAIVEDLTRLQEMQDQFIRGQIGLEREGLLRASAEVHGLLQQVRDDGPIVAARLKQFAGRRWLGIFP